MRAWCTALTAKTIEGSVPPAHLSWLTRADPGARLARNADTGEMGHVYPDVHKTPPGWLLVATQGRTRPLRPVARDEPSTDTRESA